MNGTARLALLATLASTAVVTAQTSNQPATTHKATTHRASTARPAAKATTNPADNPPGVPKVIGTPKPLYALRYVDTVLGTGELAQPRKYYTVHYTGYLTDGTKFDSSVDRGTPITFPYGAHQVIAGWDTGFQDMHVGGKRRLYIPYQLAYGESGRPPVIPAKADLIFDVELVGMSDIPPPPPVQPKPPTEPSADPTAKPATPAPAESAKPAATPSSSAPAPDAQPKNPPHPEGI